MADGKIVVIGGGAAGMMAAVTAAALGASVTLVERNERMGRKLRITGETEDFKIFCSYIHPNRTMFQAFLGKVQPKNQRKQVFVGKCVSVSMAIEQPKQAQIVVASARLDALVAAVYRLSRSESQALFDKELIFVNSLLAKSTSVEAKPGDLISVRGHGRFYYDGIDRETKKGRLRADVRIF